MGKISYAIRIEKEIRDAFSAKCSEEGIGVSVAMETLMKAYLSDAIRLKNEIKIIIGKGGNGEGNY